jgi:hypothetical protein
MIRTSVSESLTFLRENRLSTILSRVRAREVPWLIQFCVYAACGVLSTLFFIAQVVLLSKYFIPAFDGMKIDGEVLTPGLRAKNLLINNSIAFVSTNLFTYAINVLFVFKRGRHHVVAEFLYFTGVSLAAFALSQIAGPLLVSEVNLPTWAAIFTNTIASMMINFAARKFFVFQS